MTVPTSWRSSLLCPSALLAALIGVSAACSSEAAPADELGAPELVDDAQLIFHPNQPMVVDVVVELDRAALVDLSHDDDPGVKVASLAVEDEGRYHHLRVRGLAPNSEHAMTLALRNAQDESASTTRPLDFATRYQLAGFRPSFEVELGDAARLDAAYRLFDYANTPLWDPTGIFVIDAAGVTRWYYEGGLPELAGPTVVWAGLELLDDGDLLVVRDGALMIIDELGQERLRHSSLDYGLPPFHHEAHMMASGNILTLTNSFRDVDYSSLDLGLGLTHVAGDLIVEIDTSGEIVWEWDTFDHLDPLRVRSTPEEGLAYADPETGELGYDWTHGNGLVYRADDDMVLLSMRHQDWIIAIDHESGDILWRLGPEGDLDLVAGTWFYHQHSPQWQPDGSLLLYDNAIGNPDLPLAELESRAVRYALDHDGMTATQAWSSLDDDPVVSSVAGDADRTPAGNVLVLDSTLQPDPASFDIGKNFSRLRELSSEGDASMIWSLTTKPGSFVYRATATERLPGEAR